MGQKKRRDLLVGWAEKRVDTLLVWEDECWVSRFAQPKLRSWAEPEQRLTFLQRTPPTDCLDKALACYGALRHDTRQVYLHFAAGRPDTDSTIDFLRRLLALARSLRKPYLVVIWDNASWHLSRKLRAWLRAYKQTAKRRHDVRLLVSYLPSKSPWLNPIEPRWVHAKRQTLEPSSSPLTALELRRR